jgi:hypothetical protein
MLAAMTFQRYVASLHRSLKTYQAMRSVLLVAESGGLLKLDGAGGVIDCEAGCLSNVNTEELLTALIATNVNRSTHIECLLSNNLFE